MSATTNTLLARIVLKGYLDPNRPGDQPRLLVDIVECESPNGHHYLDIIQLNPPPGQEPLKFTLGFEDDAFRVCLEGPGSRNSFWDIQGTTIGV